jgi:hypothetical protein
MSTTKTYDTSPAAARANVEALERLDLPELPPKIRELAVTGSPSIRIALDALLADQDPAEDWVEVEKLRGEAREVAWVLTSDPRMVWSLILVQCRDVLQHHEAEIKRKGKLH